MIKEIIFITAGGTGGHIIPARTVAKALVENNYEVIFLGDYKIKSYIKVEDNFKSHIISASQIKKSPTFLAKACLKIAYGIWESLYFFIRYKPKYVVAFGGYATFPILIAAIMTRSKIILHEQNAHLGKVNRIFAKFSHKIATSFPSTFGIAKENLAKVYFCGNPVRAEILALHKLPYSLPTPKEEKVFESANKMGYNVILASDFYEEDETPKPFKILVIGGSGGARIFSEILPKAIFNLPERIKDKIQITQQCRAELVKSTFDQYCSYNINIAIDAFFDNMPELIRDSHLIIARSGSSSIFEFCAAKKPMILVPFAAAADDHQAKNANYLGDNHAAIVVSEKEFQINKISDLLKTLIDSEVELKKMSEAAGKLAAIDATENLVKLING
jgi:UDP-N-acetylglucosamine--N-acetylmuramyl-(pentapeptide) pyrophosphoryl-undecaprenol N-acetylglucosamine transferase